MVCSQSRNYFDYLNMIYNSILISFFSFTRFPLSSLEKGSLLFNCLPPLALHAQWVEQCPRAPGLIVLIPSRENNRTLPVRGEAREPRQPDSHDSWVWQWNTRGEMLFESLLWGKKGLCLKLLCGVGEISSPVYTRVFLGSHPENPWECVGRTHSEQKSE